jgi:hypothetical protein
MSFTDASGQPTQNPLIRKNTASRNERNNSLIVFVGEKIEVNPIAYKSGASDNAFSAKYKVLQSVYGNYTGQVIEFEAHDHYGIPPFSNYQYVLLFVYESGGKYYHEKYMYNDVYRTKDGRWAGPYSNDYQHVFNRNTTIRPQKIDFVEEVSYPTKIKNTNGREGELFYQEPYFKIIGNKAVAEYGNYVEELFKLKKDGVLTARGLFGDKMPDIKDAVLEEASPSRAYPPD